METHNSPPVPFSADAEFPIRVDNLEQYQSLLDSFKHKLFHNLTSVEPVSVSSTTTIIETKTYKIGKLTLKRTEKAITHPEELTNPVFNPDEYTIEDLWAVLAKQGKLLKVRVLLMGRQVKGTLTTSLLNKMSKKRRMHPRINREDTAMWVTIRRIVFDQLTEQQKAEWGLLSGLMAVSKGGRLLDLSHDNKRKEEIQEGPQLQGAPTITNHSDTRPIIKISAPSAHLTHESNEYPDRPGNFPRVRPQQTMIITALDPTIASLQERVHQLEIESKSAAGKRARRFTGSAHAQLRKDSATNLPEGRSWLGNRGAFARRLSLGLWENEESEFTESECSEDSDETYADEVKQQANTEYQLDHRVSMLPVTSGGSKARDAYMSPIDWVAFADG